MTLKSGRSRNATKSRKLLPLMLSLALLASPTFSQQSKTSSRISAEELGIDSTRNYSGQEVINMLAIVLEEADASIESAFNEGYKQAAVEFKPEAEYWKQKYESVKKESWRNNLKYTLCGFGLGFGFGSAGGICLTLYLN